MVSRALVAGGTRGLGAAVVATLHRAGAQVVAAARSPPAQPVADVHYVAADLATAEDCAALAKRVLTFQGSLDVVVNVVGGSRAPGGGFAATDDAVWWQDLNRNVSRKSCIAISKQSVCMQTIGSQVSIERPRSCTLLHVARLP